MAVVRALTIHPSRRLRHGLIQVLGLKRHALLFMVLARLGRQ